MKKNLAADRSDVIQRMEARLIEVLDGWEARLNKADATFIDMKPGFLVVDVVDDKVGVTAYKMNFDTAYKAMLN